jgi:hypothetical protein
MIQGEDGALPRRASLLALHDGWWKQRGSATAPTQFSIGVGQR